MNSSSLACALAGSVGYGLFPGWKPGMVTGTIESEGMLTPWLTTLEMASRSAAMLSAARMGRFSSPPSMGLFIDTPMK